MARLTLWDRLAGISWPWEDARRRQTVRLITTRGVRLAHICRSCAALVDSPVQHFRWHAAADRRDGDR